MPGLHNCIELFLGCSQIVFKLFISNDGLLLIIVPFLLVQSNAQRAHNSHWADKFCNGKLVDIGYAPILFCTIIILMVLFINSVLAGKEALFFAIFLPAADGGVLCYLS